MPDYFLTLQQLMANFWWAPPSLHVVDRPELCYCRDLVGGYNRVARIEADDDQLPGLIREFSEAFMGMDSKVVAYPAYSPRLFELLAVEGYVPGNIHDVYYKRVAAHQPSQQARFEISQVRNTDQLRLHARVNALAFGTPVRDQDADNAEHLLQEYNSARPRAVQMLATDMASQQAVGSGGMSLFDDHQAGLLFGGGTIPTARNQGVYGAMLDARMLYAKERGIDFVGVFARQSSSSPIVAKHGFIKCGEMTYWGREARSP